MCLDGCRWECFSEPLSPSGILKGLKNQSGRLGCPLSRIVWSELVGGLILNGMELQAASAGPHSRAIDHPGGAFFLSTLASSSFVNMGQSLGCDIEASAMGTDSITISRYSRARSCTN